MLIRLTHTRKLPDPVRIERYHRSPELGPKILFFTGGSALRDTSTELIGYTHNSIHIITPFDSGGSSAKLRDAFDMPAIGDIRNRLLALADRSLHGNPEIFQLFVHRFPADTPQKILQKELDSMIRGKHKLVADIPDPMRKIIRHYLYVFDQVKPKTFDLHKASIGNLVLTGGYLETRRQMDPVIFIFSRLVSVRGVVRPVVNKSLHLVAEMENGNRIVGQHLLTGKEAKPIASKVKQLYLSASPESVEPVEVSIRNKMKSLIADAEMICYPMGSFYSSIIANFLPKGVGEAIRGNSCPKIFIPNTAPDPESYGMDINEQIETLIRYLRQDNPSEIKVSDVLNFVITDTRNASYAGRLDKKKLAADDIEVIDLPLVTPESHPYIDAKQLVAFLLSLT